MVSRITNNLLPISTFSVQAVLLAVVVIHYIVKLVFTEYSYLKYKRKGCPDICHLLGKVIYITFCRLGLIVFYKYTYIDI